ncbi:ProP Permeases of the major facilitator superfamily [Mycobacteriaceae bacterium]
MFETLDTPQLTRLRRKVTVLSGGGTFLDGFDLVIIAVALPVLKDYFPGMGPGIIALIAASAIFGALIGATLGGRLTDKYGRKAMYLLDLACFVVFAVGAALAWDPWSLIAFRFLLGLGIGADYPISATLVAEFSSSKGRGAHSGSLGAMWFVGALVAYVTGILLEPLGADSWRYMFMVGAVFAVIVLILRRTLPESPRWLASVGREEDAQKIMRELTGHNVEIPTGKIKQQPISALFNEKYRRITIFVTGFWTCYAIAYYGITIYTPTILDEFNEDGSRSVAYLGAGVVALVGLIGALIGLNLADRWGRRPLIITSFSGLAAALLILTLSPAPGLGFLVMLFSVAVLFANMGGGILNFVYPTELYPTGIRATGMGFATSVSRIGSLLGVLVFPGMIAAWGQQVALGFFFAVAVLALVICLILAPETNGRTLEELSREGDYEGELSHP